MVRISAISFLNTVPLLRGHDRERDDLEIWFTTPGECADQLRAGIADVGLIPAIEYQRIGDLVMVGDAVIATKGAVRSILLLSRMPLKEVKTVAADTSSRTSVALTQILFQKRFTGQPVKMVPHAPRPKQMLEKCDAALVIGDPALYYAKNPLPGVSALDLGAEWHALTGKPFVFAFWAGNRVKSTPELAAIFDGWRDRGIAEVDQYADEEAVRRHLSREVVHDYLTENIHFTMDASCREGLSLYYQWASELNLISHNHPLEVVNSGAIAAC